MFRVPFDKLLDEATNNLKLDINWDDVLKISDLIRQGDVSPKEAVKKITKKITNSNQHTALYALCVLESCVKNCGSLIQGEISTKEFMEQYKDIIEKCTHENVKIKALDLLQSWAYAFRKIPEYRPVNDTMNIMKHEGYKFPTLKESDAMFVADVAPVWKHGNRCHRCRTEFTVTLRKHHCRACGEIFCYQCTPQTSTIPKYGIEKEVRVCISCFDKLKSGSSSKRNEELPSEYVNSSLAQQSQNVSNKKTDEELNEEEDLQLAIALSKSEHESKQRSTYHRPVTRTKSFSPPVTHKVNQYENDDPELARYLNRSYWDSRASSSDRALDRELKPNSATVTQMYDVMKNKSIENGLQSENEINEFVNTLRSQVEIFVNRMKSNSSRGRSISNDTSVQTLFMNITAMHSRLLRYIQQQDDSRVYYEGLQDKLTQVKDARAALDALREEHRERLRREAELAERQRQLQMAQKLEIMRQKKQEYLQYQRQLALQRIHDQEREMHLRQEQQKQQYRLATGPYNTIPYMVSSQGSVSAFEPVSSMNINMNNLPAAGGPYGPHRPPSFSSQYTQGQPVSSVAGSSQQQIMSAPPSNVIIGQPQMTANSYVPGNSTTSALISNPHSAHGALASSQQSAAQYQVSQTGSGVMHTSNHMKLNSQSQPVHVDSANPHAIIPSNGPVHMDTNAHVIALSQNCRVEANPHVMGPLSSLTHPGSVIHPNIARPLMPVSSPLSSPSSSSEHSIVQHGPQPMPSAPSATSTPQPEEKEEIAELISFD